MENQHRSYIKKEKELVQKNVCLSKDCVILFTMGN